MKPKPSDSGATTFSMDWPREAGLADSFVAEVERKLRKKNRRRMKTVTTSLVVVAALALASWLIPVLRSTETLNTPFAKRQLVQLSDGSTAELNADTELRSDFRYGRRTIRLDRGEAFFAVAKDTAHPFVVTTPAGDIRVTGTAFNVRVAGNDQVVVTLVEGKVVVKPVHAEATELLPSTQAAFTSYHAGLRRLDPTDVDRATAWRRGEIVLDGLTLAEATEALSKFHGIAITVSSDVSQLKPGGTFPLDDLQGFLSALETALSVKVLGRGDGSYSIIAK
jgi:transmembrane sensor